MAANTAKLVQDCLWSNGSKKESIITLTGPASYTQIGGGNPPTGGQALAATQFGLRFLSAVSCGLSADGQYTAIWSPMSATTAEGVQTGVLLWQVAHTGAEVAGAVDLSAVTLRVKAIGR